MRRKYICLALITIFLTSCSNSKNLQSSSNNESMIKQNKVKVVKSNAINNFVNSKSLKHGNVSFFALDLQNKKVVESYREESALVPASVLKIITSATALEVLGANTVLETKLLYDGKISKDGTLNGNIYIEGGGDPTLGSESISIDREEFLKKWMVEIKKAGIKSLNGNIIVLDDLFGYEGITGKWLWEDMGTSYGQGTYGISVFDNLYNLYLNTDTPGTKPKIVKLSPNIGGVTFDNQSFVTSEGKKDIYVRGVPLENKRKIYGVVPKNKNGVKIQSDIPDPGLFLGQYFSYYLKKENIKFNGTITTARLTSQRPKNPKIIAVTQSPPISEIVKILLTKSDNHYSEHLYKLIEKTKGIDIQKYWENKGIDVQSLTMVDGSGLSRGNTLSSKLLVDILAESQNDLEGLLPLAGREGTVALFLKTTSLDGLTNIKSGSMSGIQSYAGYVNKNGKNYAFAIIINHWNGTRKELREKIEKLLVEIF